MGLGATLQPATGKRGQSSRCPCEVRILASATAVPLRIIKADGQSVQVLAGLAPQNICKYLKFLHLNKSRKISHGWQEGERNQAIY